VDIEELLCAIGRVTEVATGLDFRGCNADMTGLGELAPADVTAKKAPLFNDYRSPLGPLGKAVKQIFQAISIAPFLPALFWLSRRP